MKHIQATLAFAAFAACLNGQTASEAPQLPTTIVTGDLWESELERTTASVTVIDNARLTTNGTQHFEDIVNTIPNLTWTGGSSRPRYIQIRGIGENSQFEGETPDSAVRFLIDDLDLTGLGTVGNLFDVQQVEVLRGPQAGAFGANAAGGVIRIVTNEPTPYWTGQVEGTLGEDNLQAAGLAVGGPLLENDPEQLTFRLALHQLTSDGFRDNQFLGHDDTNERDELTTRLKLRWIANLDWQWDGTFLYAHADNGYDEFSLGNTEFDTFSDEPGRDEQETVAGSIRGTWTGLDRATLTSISSYTDTDALFSFDADWADPTTDGNYDGFISTNRDREVFSQEFRFDSIEQEDALGWIDRWTLGFYIQTLGEETEFTYTEFDSLSADFTSDYDSDLYALFGQIAHDFSDATRLIVGLRAEYYSIDVSSSGQSYGTPRGGDSKQSDPLFGGKITIEHDLNENHMLFGSIARGYKAGGANVSSFSFDFDPATYEDETLYNFEIGLRSNWFDGAVITQITGFYLRREDAQLRDSAGAGGFFRYLTVNGNDAAHYGLEADATWYLNENWTISAGLGLLQTSRKSYTAIDSDESIDVTLDADFDNDPITVFVPSRDLANAPAYNYHFRLDYRSDCGFFANLEVVGSDSYYESNSHNEKRNAFGVVNGAVGYRYENWTITLWAKNLFDEEYEKRVFKFGNRFDTSTADPFDFEADRRYEDPADPQQFGITANYSW
jgi:outer membrane receptor protein involved in Fe transport